MSGPIERFWRMIPRHQVVPVAMLVFGVYAAPDPTRRPTGYGGVLPLPTAATGAAAASTPRPDPLLEQQRRDFRASRGRVLYAPGRGPGATAAAPAATPAKAAPKSPCPTRRVSEQHAARTSPSF
ncbi:MAG: hypothetical protein ABI205_06010 [Gemmatimonadaceae bacterium]